MLGTAVTGATMTARSIGLPMSAIDAYTGFSNTRW